MYRALQDAVLEPAAAAIEAELRLRLFALSEATDATGNGPESEAALAARGVAEAAGQEVRWAVPIAALPRLRLVTSVVQLRRAPPAIPPHPATSVAAHLLPDALDHMLPVC